MTQALTNNINMTQDTTLVTQPKSNVCNDFDKLFKKQSLMEENNQIENSSSENSKENLLTLGNLKKGLSTTLTNFQNILQETKGEIEQEAALALGLIKDDELISDNSTDLSIQENITSEEENIINILPTEIKIDETSQYLDTTSILQLETLTNTTNATQESSNENVNISDSEDLKVTINGCDIENLFDNIEVNNLEEQSSSNSVKSNDIESAKIEDIIDEDKLKELNIENIEAEVSSDSENSENNLMQNQTPQEQGVKAILQGELNYKDVYTSTSSKTPTSTSVSHQQLSTEKIIEQISKQLSNINNTSKLNIVLNPEKLGKVALQIVNTSEGLSAQFSVTTQEVRDLIMKGLDGLRESLLSQGVSVDNVSVKLQDAQKSEYQQDWTEQDNSKGGYKQQKEQHKRDDENNFERLIFNAEEEKTDKV